MNEIYQHNFKTIKPESIFTSSIVNPQMCEDIEKEIREMGDRQDHKTNVKAQMTEWDMKDKPGFKVLKEKILDKLVIVGCSVELSSSIETNIEYDIKTSYEPLENNSIFKLNLFNISFKAPFNFDE